MKRTDCDATKPTCRDEDSSWLRCLTVPRYMSRVSVFTSSSSWPPIAAAVFTTEQVVNSFLKPAC